MKVLIGLAYFKIPLHFKNIKERDYTVSQKKEATELWAVTLSNLNRF